MAGLMTPYIFWLLTDKKILTKKIDPLNVFQRIMNKNSSRKMQTYYFFNKSTGEVVEQVFRHVKQVEQFLEKSSNFELMSGPLENLPVRGTRKID